MVQRWSFWHELWLRYKRQYLLQLRRKDISPARSRLLQRNSNKFKIWRTLVLYRGRSHRQWLAKSLGLNSAPGRSRTTKTSKRMSDNWSLLLTLLNIVLPVSEHYKQSSSNDEIVSPLKTTEDIAKEVGLSKRSAIQALTGSYWTIDHIKSTQGFCYWSRRGGLANQRS